ncbi:MAG: chromosome partitioning protein ParB, partial [Actinobacteria bacterium]|nr:chromosome partitioning protein ParB [Actinomycetota bacterium]
ALLGLSDSSEIEKLATRIVAQGLSVRATEEIISTGAPKRKSAKKLKVTKSATPELQEIADTMGDSLDTRVSIQGSMKKGTIVIEFAGAEDLKRIAKAINN